MKRLILTGGRPWLAGEGGKDFVDAVLRYLPNEVKLAFCIFAQPKSEWEETRRINMDMFEACKKGHTITYRTLTMENFAEVSAWADIVYLPGGNPFALYTAVTAAGDVAKLWDGKLMAGSSAGADVFCAGFTYLQDKTFGHGLGWVPATCIPHWQSDFNGYTDADWDWAEQESLRQFPALPVLCLPETKCVELTVK